MSFEDHSTYGEVSVFGFNGKIHLNHPFSLMSNPLNAEKNIAFFLHCLVLDRKETEKLIKSLTGCLKLLDAIERTTAE